MMMMLTLMLTSKGVAGVPRAALVALTATLGQFKLPLEGAAILSAIDQILDMGRTSVNVMGNCIATAVVARWEGVFDDEKMKAFATHSQRLIRRVGWGFQPPANRWPGGPKRPPTYASKRLVLVSFIGHIIASPMKP